MNNINDKEIAKKILQEGNKISKEVPILCIVILLQQRKLNLSFKDLITIGFSCDMVDKIVANIWFSKEEIEFIANMPDDYVKAITIVGRIYAEKNDRSGNPQSKHLSIVSDALETYEGKVAGYLHDIVEDGYLTLGSLLNIFHINEKSVHIVDVLTRDVEMYPTYDSYIMERILPSEILEVQEAKLADMKHNQSPERVKDLPTEEQRHKASTKYKPYIPLVEARAKELKLERKVGK